MNSVALASPLTQPQPFLGQPAVPASPPPGASEAGLSVTAANCVALTASWLQAACGRGQLEDASAAARIALPQAANGSPHEAMLRMLALAQPALMTAPEEHRLYLLRGPDGHQQDLLRLRDNGRVGAASARSGASPMVSGTAWASWQLRDGNLELSDAAGSTHTRFALCGQQGGPGVPKRLYLGEALADGAPRVLQEVNCTYARLRMLDPELAGPFCSLYDIEELAPAELPSRSALLLAAPHCGAEALTDALNLTREMHFDAELLSPLGIALADGPLSAHAAGTLYSVRAKDPAWFARMMLARSHDGAGRDLQSVPVHGFTLAPAHSGAALDWAIQEPALRIVYLVRSNLLAEFADILTAHSGAWFGLLFEPERFSRFVEMKQRSNQALRERLIARNGDTVEVDASRMNAATLMELRGFLTDQPARHDAADLSIALSAGAVIERFDNPDAVQDCLAALGQSHWAAIEGLLPAGAT